jgi:HAAS domain-containing protein
MAPNAQQDAQEKIEAYLSRLRGLLRGMNGEDVREILEELRGHIVEKAASGGNLTPWRWTRLWLRWAARKN